MEDEKLSLTTPTEKLEERILNEDNPDELKNIIDLFNLNIKKKDIIRAGKLNELQDKTLSQIQKRIEEHPDLFSNKDLLDYYKVMQDTLNKSNTNIDDVPKIQINNIVNVKDEEELDRESKKRVMDAVKAILDSSNEEENIIDIEEED